MNKIYDLWICAHCGFFSKEQFPDDICPACNLTDWQCLQCGYTLTAKAGPPVCVQCGAMDGFRNISGYIPDWSTIGAADPLLAV